MKNRWEHDEEAFYSGIQARIERANNQKSTINYLIDCNKITWYILLWMGITLVDLMIKYDENKIKHANSRSRKESDVFNRIDGIILNVLGIGTNAGRLFEHIDTEFYRNRIRSV